VSNPDGAGSGDFITADVDGVRVRAAFDPSASTSGGNGTEITVTAGKTSLLDGWKLIIANQVGTTTCPPSWMGLFELNTPLRCSDGPAARCTVTVTAAAPTPGDVLEGTFTAMLAPYGADPSTARTTVVTNGAFHVTRNLQ
jgi:hypothetical protein